jgi:hypothetical protein
MLYCDHQGMTSGGPGLATVHLHSKLGHFLALEIVEESYPEGVGTDRS